jgi:hypothetical protein
MVFLSFSIWYLFPYIAYKWFFFNTKEFKKYLEVKPVIIDKTVVPPHEWSNIDIGSLSLKIPLSQCRKITGGENYISFKLESGYLLISEIAPHKDLKKLMDKNEINYPLIAYQDRIAMYNSTSSDIAIFNSRQKNKEGSINQILKFLSISNGGIGEINFINNKMVKAICIKTKDKKKRSTAFLEIYSLNEQISFSIMVKNYDTQNTLDLEVLKILAGIKMPNQPPNIEEVERDIKALIDKFNIKT